MTALRGGSHGCQAPEVATLVIDPPVEGTRTGLSLLRRLRCRTSEARVIRVRLGVRRMSETRDGLGPRDIRGMSLRNWESFSTKNALTCGNSGRVGGI